VLCDFDSDTISQFSGIIAISPDSQLAQFFKKIQDEYKLYFGKRHVGEQRIIQTDNNQAPMVLSLVDFSITEAA